MSVLLRAFSVARWTVGLACSALLLWPAVPARAIELPEGFEQTQFTSGLALPTAMEFAPDGRLFVCEKGGNLRVIDSTGLLPTPFLSVVVNSESERGLLGVAFDPDFATNRYVYVYYTRATAPIKNRLSRFTASTTNPNLAEEGSEVILLDDIASDAGNHNGGAIHFGSDRKLYVGIGDGGANPTNSQSLATLSGKLLRIDPAAYPNLIPADNPFVGTPDARGEIWLLGLRNPFTFAMQSGTSTIFVNDVGQNTWEEVNRAVAGGNYGWPEAEGNSTNPAFQNPVYAYNHNGSGASIAGGAFYQANQFPQEYADSYFFGDYVLGFIRRLAAQDYTQALDFATDVPGPVDLRVGPDGSLYYLSFFTGSVNRIAYVGGANRAPTAAIRARSTAGDAPLRVYFSALSSSDPDNDALSYIWDFGDGAPTATTPSVSHVYQTGQYTASLSVSDPLGASSSTTISVTSGSNLPTAKITRPDRYRYSAGSTVSFAAIGTDKEDGSLPASAFSWSVIFHHDEHTHPLLGPVNGVKRGTFQIPKTGETSADVFYRVQLTVKDSSGLSRVLTRDIRPRRTRLAFQTSPPGLQLTLDGQPLVAPESVIGVTGATRTLGAPATQQRGDISYQFVNWSDGGAATHTIQTPVPNTTYTAVYRQLP
ncbi:MAG: PQQ-dependent sugar dehydrogenase [Gemmatimonadaceae bacterium]|nr:PQQ-dependent sugar dehydrogenase [Gloeobacterales cyanobacterium ES-bin-141]